MFFSLLPPASFAMAWAYELVGISLYYPRVGVHGLDVYVSILTELNANRQFFSSGFGTGLAQIAVFESLRANIDEAHLAPAISLLYLSTGIGLIVGLACMNSVLQAGLRVGLNRSLRRMGLSDEVVQNVSGNWQGRPKPVAHP